MAVNFCSNCGAKVRAGAKFCGSCGQKIYSEEKKLPPMPYEKSKSVMEVYAEKKAAAKVQTKSDSIQAIFSNAKTNSQTSGKVTGMEEIHSGEKANPRTQATVTPKYPTSAQSIYNPPVITNLKKDTTLKEMFFSTEGRLNSQRYFNRTLLVNLALIVLLGVIFSVCSTPWGDVTRSGEALLSVVGVAALIPKYCLDVRRLKDIGKACPGMKAEDCTESSIQVAAATYATFALISMYFLSDWDPDSRMSIPGHVRAISAMLTGSWLWMQFKSGTVGANKFGEDPLANERRMNL